MFEIGEIQALVAAIVSNTVSLWTGVIGLVFTVVGVFWKNARPKRVFLALGLFTLFLSPVYAWRDEYRNAEKWKAQANAKDEAIKQRDAEIRELKAPRQPVAAPLYYGDKPLNGARITLERGNPDPRLCTTMHVWSPQPGAESFALCGIWVVKSDEAPNSGALYVDFSEEIVPAPGTSCYPSPEPTTRRYKVSFICYGAVIGSANRWNLRFYGAPVPAKATGVWLRIPYGHRLAEATFTLLPPNR